MGTELLLDSVLLLITERMLVGNRKQLYSLIGVFTMCTVQVEVDQTCAFRRCLNHQRLVMHVVCLSVSLSV